MRTPKTAKITDSTIMTMGSTVATVMIKLNATTTSAIPKAIFDFLSDISNKPPAAYYNANSMNSVKRISN